MSAKTTELIIYIADRTRDVPHFGAVLLNKTLYYIDMMSYLKKGGKLTDLPYIRQQKGPTPETYRFRTLLQHLKDNGDIIEKEEPYFNQKTKKIYSQRSANIDVFEKDEISLIEEVINKFRVMGATEASNLTHDLLAWQLAVDMESLPDHTFLLTSKDPEPHQIEKGQKIAAEFLKSRS